MFTPTADFDSWASFNPALGPELVTNGGFDDETGWTLGGTEPPTISGGKLRGVVNDDGWALSLASLSAGTYRLVYTIDSIENGRVQVTAGNDGSGAERDSAGSYSEDVAITGGSDIFISVLSSDAVIDNVSVRRVL